MLTSDGQLVDEYRDPSGHDVIFYERELPPIKGILKKHTMAPGYVYGAQQSPQGTIEGRGQWIRCVCVCVAGMGGA